MFLSCVFFRMRPRINRLMRLRQLIQGFVNRLALPRMADATVVGDSVNKSPLRALAAKMGERLPDGQRDLLEQLFPPAGHGLIAGGKARQSRSVLTHDIVEMLFQGIPVLLAHVMDPIRTVR